jgi:hypothetical protein
VRGSSYEVEERFRSSREFRIVDPLAAARAFSWKTRLSASTGTCQNSV